MPSPCAPWHRLHLRSTNAFLPFSMSPCEGEAGADWGLIIAGTISKAVNPAIANGSLPRPRARDVVLVFRELLNSPPCSQDERILFGGTVYHLEQKDRDFRIRL